MSEITSYIRSLELPEAPTRRGPEAQEPPPDFTGAHQAMTVGSQLAEFSNACLSRIRPAISNALLLGNSQPTRRRPGIRTLPHISAPLTA